MNTVRCYRLHTSGKSHTKVFISGDTLTRKTEVAYLELVTFECKLENVLDCRDNRVGKNIPLVGTMNNISR